MDKPKRKLAAIVFTDIVGFTELSAKNEPAALELLNTQRKILKPIVEGHDGDWLKEIGDGLLLTFNTNIEAVLCSIAIQEAAKSIPELDLRIGIHQGEVVFQGDDVVGDDVNIASRIEPFSSSGGIAISDRVNASLERDPEFESTFIGKPALKGVSQEIKVYCVTSHGLPQTDPIKVKAKLEPVRTSFFKKYVFPITGCLLALLGGIFWFLLPLLTIGSAVDIHDYEKRIAVLYLENRGSEEDSYFSEGLTEEIITRLSRVNKISVVSRFNVVEYKGKNINLDDIRDNLGADYLLTGNVMKLNEKIKISVELVDLEKQDVEWSTSFEKDMSDIFSIQDEIAINIVENLDINIGSRDKNLVLADPTTNVGAYNALTKMRSVNATSIQSNIEELDTIINDDTTYADALGLRAMYLSALMNYGDVDWEKTSLQAMRDAEKALSYDSSNLYGLIAKSIQYIIRIIMSDDNTTSKILAARRALVSINNLKEQHPDHYMVDVALGQYYSIKIKYKMTMNADDYKNLKEHFTDAFKSIEKVVNSDPMAPLLYQLLLSDFLLFETDFSYFSDAIYYGDKLADLLVEQNNIQELDKCYGSLIAPNFMLGNYERVIDIIISMQGLAKQLPESDYRDIYSNLYLGLSYAELGQEELGIDIINGIDETKFKWSMWDTFRYKSLAKAYYLSGNNDKEYEYIKKAYDINKKDFVDVNSSKDFFWQQRPDIYNDLYGNLMFLQSYLAKYHVEDNDITSALKYINELEEMLSNISALHFTVSIDIYYNLAMAYGGLNKENEYNKYLDIAFDELTKISNRLNDEHKQMYLNNVRVNKNVIDLTNS